jgi:hypothetical protein
MLTPFTWDVLTAQDGSRQLGCVVVDLVRRLRSQMKSSLQSLARDGVSQSSGQSSMRVHPPKRRHPHGRLGPRAVSRCAAVALCRRVALCLRVALSSRFTLAPGRSSRSSAAPRAALVRAAVPVPLACRARRLAQACQWPRPAGRAGVQWRHRVGRAGVQWRHRVGRAGVPVASSCGLPRRAVASSCGLPRRASGLILQVAQGCVVPAGRPSRPPSDVTVPGYPHRVYRPSNSMIRKDSCRIGIKTLRSDKSLHDFPWQ